MLLVNSRSRFVKKEFRDEVIGKKWMYLERNRLRRQTVGQLRRPEAPEHDTVSLYRLGVLSLSVGGLFQLFLSRGRDFKNWATTHFWVIYGYFRTVMVLVGVSFSNT